MTVPAEATSIRHEIVVRAPIDRAFSVFTDGFGTFKPREHNMLGVDIAETVFEPRVGGQVYDRGVDGGECRWARVLAYEPPERVVISWDINPQWQIETDPDQRGRGALQRRDPRADARRARAPQPRSSRRRLGGRPRGCRLRGRLAALPAALRRRHRRLSRCPRSPRSPGRTLAQGR
jgi:uncharacterized protein YndB with AHSA1/START domain